MLEEKILITFIEVKMNEYQIPWEENPEDQNDSLFPEAKLQLKKDVIRFLELFPDVKLSGKLDILCFAAFPNLETDEKITKDRSLILIKPDFENTEILSNKLHFCSVADVNEEVKKLYTFIFGRFIGPMSTIPNKSASTMISVSNEALNLSTASTNTAMKSLIENIDPVDDTIDRTLKEKLLDDQTTQNILQALASKKYQKKFAEQYPGINLPDLGISKKQSKYPLQSKKGNTFPIFGVDAIKKVLDHFDENLYHQGKEEIMTKLDKEKIDFYGKDSNGNYKKVEQTEILGIIEDLNRDCEECKIVNELKSCGVSKGKLTTLHSETHIFKALKFADKFHTGENTFRINIIVVFLFRLHRCME